jgi:hypothetical protein
MTNTALTTIDAQASQTMPELDLKDIPLMVLKDDGDGNILMYLGENKLSTAKKEFKPNQIVCFTGKPTYVTVYQTCLAEGKPVKEYKNNRSVGFAYDAGYTKKGSVPYTSPSVVKATTQAYKTVASAVEGMQFTEKKQAIHTGLAWYKGGLYRLNAQTSAAISYCVSLGYEPYVAVKDLGLLLQGAYGGKCKTALDPKTYLPIQTVEGQAWSPDGLVMLIDEQTASSENKRGRVIVPYVNEKTSDEVFKFINVAEAFPEMELDVVKTIIKMYTQFAVTPKVQQFNQEQMRSLRQSWLNNVFPDEANGVGESVETPTSPVSTVAPVPVTVSTLDSLDSVLD